MGCKKVIQYTVQVIALPLTCSVCILALLPLAGSGSVVEGCEYIIKAPYRVTRRIIKGKKFFSEDYPFSSVFMFENVVYLRKAPR